MKYTEFDAVTLADFLYSVVPPDIVRDVWVRTESDVGCQVKAAEEDKVSGKVQPKTTGRAARLKVRQATDKLKKGEEPLPPGVVALVSLLGVAMLPPQSAAERFVDLVVRMDNGRGYVFPYNQPVEGEATAIRAQWIVPMFFSGDTETAKSWLGRLAAMG